MQNTCSSLRRALAQPHGYSMRSTAVAHRTMDGEASNRYVHAPEYATGLPTRHHPIRLAEETAPRGLAEPCLLIAPPG